MKKVLALLTAFALILSLAACGEKAGAPAASSAPEATSKFTPEQQALADDYIAMAEDFDALADKVNALPEELRSQELVDNMNELGNNILELSEVFADPASLTSEAMGALKVTVEATRALLAEAHANLDEVAAMQAESAVEPVVVPVEIVNMTGVEIHTLALSPSNSNDWGENLLDEVIGNGETLLVEMPFTEDTLLWDLLVEDGSGNQLTFMGVDFSDANVEGAQLVLTATEGGDYFASVN
jgi:predicted small lipoprotein YifL